MVVQGFSFVSFFSLPFKITHHLKLRNNFCIYTKQRSLEIPETSDTRNVNNLPETREKMFLSFLLVPSCLLLVHLLDRYFTSG